MTHLLPLALSLSDSGLDMTAVIGECFAIDQFQMKPAPRRQAGFDGWLPNAQRIQVKCKGPNKLGRLPVESEFFPNVAGYQFDIFLGVQLTINYRIWRYVLLTVELCKHYITSQTQPSYNGAVKEHCLRLDTVTNNRLWVYV